MLTHVIAFVLCTPASPALAAPAPEPVTDEIEAARPDALSVTVRQEEHTLTVKARFRLRNSELPTEIRFEFSDGLAELRFMVDGVTHVEAQYVDEAEPQVRFSPEFSNELSVALWAVVTDPRLYAEVEQQLTAGPAPQEANPACKWFKWGMMGAAFITAKACCVSTAGAGCLVCEGGSWLAQKYLSTIDCNKDCKPECPL